MRCSDVKLREAKSDTIIIRRLKCTLSQYNHDRRAHLITIN